jgi:hypothetical protein
MADISPGQYPTTPEFESVTITTVTPGYQTETMAGKVRRVAQGHSYYTWEAKYPSLTPYEAGRVQGFLAQAMGPFLSFEIVLPEISYSNNLLAATANASLVTANAITAGSKGVLVKNSGLLQGDTFMYAGDFFKFGGNFSGNSKVYMCTQDVSVFANGNAFIGFSGSAVSNVSINTPVTINAVPFTAIISEDSQQYSVGSAGITTMTVKMREVW